MIDQLLIWLLEQVPVIVVMGVVIHAQYKEKARLLDDLKSRNDYIIERDREMLKIMEGFESILFKIADEKVSKSDLIALEHSIKTEIATLKK